MGSIVRWNFTCYQMSKSEICTNLKSQIYTNLVIKHSLEWCKENRGSQQNRRMKSYQINNWGYIINVNEIYDEWFR